MVATGGGSIQVLGQRWGGGGVNYDFQCFFFYLLLLVSTAYW